jgi:ribosomal protein L10
MILNRGLSVVRNARFPVLPCAVSGAPPIVPLSPPVRKLGKLAQRYRQAQQKKKWLAIPPDETYERFELTKFVEEERKRLKKPVKWSEVDLENWEPKPPKLPEPVVHREDGKTYYKHPKRYNSSIQANHSRKHYLHTIYANLLLRHPVILFIDLTKVDAHTVLDLRVAMREHGADVKFIRRRMFVSALRVVKYIEQARVRPHEVWHPSGLAMRTRVLMHEKSEEEYEMRNMLKNSQTLAVFFDDFKWRPETVDPKKIAAVIKLVEETDKAKIVGARIQRRVATAESLQKIKGLVSYERSWQELFGVLRGRGNAVAGTLTAPLGKLALTLEGRAKAMKEGDGQK